MEELFIYLFFFFFFFFFWGGGGMSRGQNIISSSVVGHKVKCQIFLGERGWGSRLHFCKMLLACVIPYLWLPLHLYSFLIVVISHQQHFIYISI